MPPTLDQLQRPLHDLRVSVIDACNLRCTYCMPAARVPWAPFLKQQQWLSVADTARLVRLFVALGVVKVRLTGGEPLLRPDLPELVRALSAIPGIADLALSTNGLRLPELAQPLRAAGLQRLSVSLDALDDATFGKMNGRGVPVAQVLAGIAAATTAGFGPLKINVVVQRGVNDHAVVDLARHFRGSGHTVRFIEYMDVGNLNDWQPGDVVPGAEVVARIGAVFPLQALPPRYPGEVAKRYAYADGQGEIGVITSVSAPFCGDCHRARLSADGKLFTCLFAGQGHDLAGPLRAGASDAKLQALIQARWQHRNDRYSEERAERRAQAPTAAKVEMYRIGG